MDLDVIHFVLHKPQTFGPGFLWFVRGSQAKLKASGAEVWPAPKNDRLLRHGMEVRAPPLGRRQNGKAS